MRRTCTKFLQQWLLAPNRKPLVIRGARQVGKTWIVRDLAQINGRKLIEINFEKTHNLASLFSSNDPKEILHTIEERLSTEIDPSKSILFLDEIQAQPELLSKLRWFYEDMPELPVIAASSLLEFILNSYPLSMPVGRISFLYLEPFSFIEFLLALKKDVLVDVLEKFDWNNKIHEEVHKELMNLFKQYVYIGGLPAAVSSWTTFSSLEQVKNIHRDLLGTYRADFSKYSRSVSIQNLNTIIDSIPRHIGEKIVFSNLDSHASIAKTKQSIDLLTQADLIHKVISTAANGLSLGAEVNQKFMKAILLDVGLCSAELKLSLSSLKELEELDMVNKGAIAEQVAGQILRTLEPCYENPSLYYWTRHKKGSDAEVDYIISHKGKIIPIEVKAGSKGNLKSLHQFMRLKELKQAIRIYSAPPSITHVKVQDQDKTMIEYELRSIPFYLISELQRLLG